MEIMLIDGEEAYTVVPKLDLGRLHDITYWQVIRDKVVEVIEAVRRQHGH